MPCLLCFHVFHSSLRKCLLSMKALLFLCCRTELWIIDKVLSSAEIKRDKNDNRIFQLNKCTFVGCPVQIHPFTGGNTVALTLQAGQIEHKKGSACFRQGQEKVACKVLTDVYLRRGEGGLGGRGGWGRGGGAWEGQGWGGRSTFLSCRWVLVPLWSVCYAMFTSWWRGWSLRVITW